MGPPHRSSTANGVCEGPRGRMAYTHERQPTPAARRACARHGCLRRRRPERWYDAIA